jgi:hypothetical protein
MNITASVGIMISKNLAIFFKRFQMFSLGQPVYLSAHGESEFTSSVNLDPEILSGLSSKAFLAAASASAFLAFSIVGQTDVFGAGAGDILDISP